MTIYIPVNPPNAWGKNSKNSFNGKVVTNASIASTKSLMVGLLANFRPEKPLKAFAVKGDGCVPTKVRAQIRYQRWCLYPEDHEAGWRQRSNNDQGCDGEFAVLQQ